MSKFSDFMSRVTYPDDLSKKNDASANANAKAKDGKDEAGGAQAQGSAGASMGKSSFKNAIYMPEPIGSLSKIAAPRPNEVKKEEEDIVGIMGATGLAVTFANKELSGQEQKAVDDAKERVNKSLEENKARQEEKREESNDIGSFTNMIATASGNSALTNAYSFAFFEKNIVPYIVAGYPTLDYTESLIVKFAESGINAIELAIPFSDPTAEDPIVQTACAKALQNDISPDGVLEMVSRLRTKRNIALPITLICYANTVYSRGIDAFMQKCKDSGISGITIVDLPYEERDEFAPSAEKAGLIYINTIASTTVEQATSERIGRIVKDAQGYIKVFANSFDSMLTTLEQVKEYTKLPLIPALGELSREDSQRIAPLCDGVILDTAIIDRIDSRADVSMFVYGMKRNLGGK